MADPAALRRLPEQGTLDCRRSMLGNVTGRFLFPFRFQRVALVNQDAEDGHYGWAMAGR